MASTQSQGILLSHKALNQEYFNPLFSSMLFPMLCPFPDSLVHRRPDWSLPLVVFFICCFMLVFLFPFPPKTIIPCLHPQGWNTDRCCPSTLLPTSKLQCLSMQATLWLGCEVIDINEVGVVCSQHSTNNSGNLPLKDMDMCPSTHPFVQPSIQFHLNFRYDPQFMHGY